MDHETIVKTAVGVFRHNQNEGTKKYYEWVRTCLTVSSGSLALLVALQDNFVPSEPIWSWSLRAAWVSFALTIVSALLVLRSEFTTHIQAANEAFSQKFIEMLQQGNLAQIGSCSIGLPWYYRIAQAVFPWSFAVSFVLLAVFAVANLERA